MRLPTFLMNSRGKVRVAYVIDPEMCGEGFLYLSSCDPSGSSPIRRLFLAETHHEVFSAYPENPRDFPGENRPLGVLESME